MFRTFPRATFLKWRFFALLILVGTPCGQARAQFSCPQLLIRGTEVLPYVGGSLTVSNQEFVSKTQTDFFNFVGDIVDAVCVVPEEPIPQIVSGGPVPSSVDPQPIPLNRPIVLTIPIFPAQYEGAFVSARNDAGGIFEAFGFFDGVTFGRNMIHVDTPGAQVLSINGQDACSPPESAVSLTVQYSSPGKKSITATDFFCDPITGAPTGEVAGTATIFFDAGGAQFQISANVPSGAIGPVQAIAVPDGGRDQRGPAVQAGTAFHAGVRFD